MTFRVRGEARYCGIRVEASMWLKRNIPIKKHIVNRRGKNVYLHEASSNELNNGIVACARQRIIIRQEMPEIIEIAKRFHIWRESTISQMGKP